MLRFLSTVLEAFGNIARRQFLYVLTITLLVWLISAGVMYAVLTAFGMAGMWAVSVLLSVALIFSNLLPTPPALVGMVGAVTEAVLVPLNVSTSYALAIGTMLNIVLVAPPVLLGGWAVGIRLLRSVALLQRYSLRDALGLSLPDPPGESQ
jgi:uncharacterized membrane protein YbhN (UPF0104 family)